MLSFRKVSDINFFDINTSCDRRAHPYARRSTKSISDTFLKDVISYYYVAENEVHLNKIIYATQAYLRDH